MFEKLAYAQTLVEELKNKSAELDCKVDDVQEIVANFKCAFKSLEEDVTVLESAESELLALEKEAEIQLKQHGVESECDFEDLLTLVESKKEEVDSIKEMAIPCGGLGWKRVEYQDFRNRPCYLKFLLFLTNLIYVVLQKMMRLIFILIVLKSIFPLMIWSTTVCVDVSKPSSMEHQKDLILNLF